MTPHSVDSIFWNVSFNLSHNVNFSHLRNLKKLCVCVCVCVCYKDVVFFFFFQRCGFDLFFYLIALLPVPQTMTRKLAC